MPADSFAANFLKGRLEPTILYMGHRGPGSWEGTGVYSNGEGGMATNGPHCIIIKTHPACDYRAEQMAALWTRGGGERREFA